MLEPMQVPNANRQSASRAQTNHGAQQGNERNGASFLCFGIGICVSAGTRHTPSLSVMQWQKQSRDHLLPVNEGASNVFCGTATPKNFAMLQGGTHSQSRNAHTFCCRSTSESPRATAKARIAPPVYEQRNYIKRIRPGMPATLTQVTISDPGHLFKFGNQGNDFTAIPGQPASGFRVFSTVTSFRPMLRS